MPATGIFQPFNTSLYTYSSAVFSELEVSLAIGFIIYLKWNKFGGIQYTTIYFFDDIVELEK